VRPDLQYRVMTKVTTRSRVERRDPCLQPDDDDHFRPVNPSDHAEHYKNRCPSRVQPRLFRARHYTNVSDRYEFCHNTSSYGASELRSFRDSTNSLVFQLRRSQWLLGYFIIVCFPFTAIFRQQFAVAVKRQFSDQQELNLRYRKRLDGARSQSIESIP
jgi:hypothetical protein